MLVLSVFFSFLTSLLVAYFILPATYKYVVAFNQKRAYRFSVRLERVVPRSQARSVVHMYMLAPIGFGALSYIFFPPGKMQIVGAVFGGIFGLIFPTIYTRFLIFKNKKMFDDQLIDALMIMSSSFRGGLSLIQAMEAVTDEMPDPMNQELSIVLGENKMGVSMEESFDHLYNRKPSAALQQMITAILLARETGGNLPAIFQRIVGVIRQRKRILGQIETLTLQGKIQGVVMSILPVAFFMFINASNPEHFKPLFDTEIGKTAFAAAVILEIIGAFMIWKISSFKDF
ncbi:MAG: type II secretion system F family protein [Candidatus Omnitrophota bacterium]